ncbi:hypothetical protein IGI04_010942, partial [Brassica rapa subsp. trilocularis]
ENSSLNNFSSCCPCRERIFNEVSPKPKYSTDFDIFMGVDTSPAKTSRTMTSTFVNHGLSVSRKRFTNKEAYE